LAASTHILLSDWIIALKIIPAPVKAGNIFGVLKISHYPGIPRFSFIESPSNFIDQNNPGSKL
jgi:hypothetical protein